MGKNEVKVEQSNRSHIIKLRRIINFNVTNEISNNALFTGFGAFIALLCPLWYSIHISNSFDLITEIGATVLFSWSFAILIFVLMYIILSLLSIEIRYVMEYQ
jgi:hypothetical protein